MPDRQRRFEVFTLGTNKWKKLLDVEEEYLKHDIMRSICVGGIIYFLQYPRGSETPRANSSLEPFDVHDEKFQRVASPEFTFLVGPDTQLAQFGGHLGLFTRKFFTQEDNTWDTSVWVLEDLQNQVWRQKRFVIAEKPPATNMIMFEAPDGPGTICPTLIPCSLAVRSWIVVAFCDHQPSKIKRVVRITVPYFHHSILGDDGVFFHCTGGNYLMCSLTESPPKEPLIMSIDYHVKNILPLKALAEVKGLDLLRSSWH